MQIDGSPWCNTAPSITYHDLGAGTYTYGVVSPVQGQTIAARNDGVTVPTNGTLVLGQATKIAYSFAYRYTVTFVGSGLTSGTWSIKIQGFTVTAAWNGSIEFHLTNRTYGYKIGTETGYRSAGSPHKVTVNGAGTVVTVTFTKKR